MAGESKVDGLTVRQRRFAEAYAGSATDAAIAAGYSPRTACTKGSALLRRENIVAIIRNRIELEDRPLVASRVERQERLTAILRGEGEKTVDRIKAIEVLGKMEGDFLERVEHSGAMAVRWATPEEARDDG